MPSLVLELRGDGLVEEQVRRIVGAAVGVANGWLPDGEDFWSVAFRLDVRVETVPAPRGRVYLGHVRFHFVELCAGGKRLFEDEEDGEDDCLHGRILETVAKKGGGVVVGGVT